MKTKALLLAVLFGSALAVSAQNAQRYEPQVGFSTERGSKTNFKKNKATDNVFISLAGGANVLFGDLNGNAELMDRIAPSGAISVGKWYNPYLAFRLQVNGGKMRNYSYVTDYKSDNAQEFWWINPHVDLMWDVTNFFAPYKESKVFRFIPFVGLGYALRPGYTDDKTHTSFPRAESASLNGGAQFMFRLSKRVDLFLEGQYTLLGEHWNWDSHPRPRYDRAVQAMLGLNFNLGRKECEVIEPMDYNLLNDLNDQINRLREENAELAKRPEFCPECPKCPEASEQKENLENVVYFRLNSAKIDKHQEISIFNTAEYAKKYNLPIKLVGYADKKTGNPDYNKGISERRARAVAKRLIDKYGVSSDNISIEWMGDTVQPYAENAWNRVVIMNTDNK